MPNINQRLPIKIKYYNLYPVFFILSFVMLTNLAIAQSSKWNSFSIMAGDTINKYDKELKRQGVWITYFPNTKLIESYENYKDNMKLGLCDYYHKNPYKLSSQIHYRNDTIVGRMFQYDKKGNLYYEYMYNERGKLDFGIRSYYASGYLKQEQVVDPYNGRTVDINYSENDRKYSDSMGLLLEYKLSQNIRETFDRNDTLMYNELNVNSNKYEKIFINLTYIRPKFVSQFLAWARTKDGIEFPFDVVFFKVDNINGQILSWNYKGKSSKDLEANMLKFITYFKLLNNIEVNFAKWFNEVKLKTSLLISDQCTQLPEMEAVKPNQPINIYLFNPGMRECDISAYLTLAYGSNGVIINEKNKIITIPTGLRENTAVMVGKIEYLYKAGQFKAIHTE
ncbi:MAG: hypothetical protein SGJ04_03135 [Bacteroidota bacterium]|nr:hypothetical protein [Bacteroidota bacterium]